MSLAADDRLGHLGPFQPLSEIADYFGVEIRIVGGTAIRLASDLIRDRVGALITDYCPFATTIELVHSGPDVLTPLIKDVINQVVPFAPWCPIEMKGEFRERPHRRANAVPLMGISFSTKHGFQGRRHGIADLESGFVSLDQQFVDAVKDPAALDRLPKVMLDAFAAACDLGDGRLSQTAEMILSGNLLRSAPPEGIATHERARLKRQLADVTARASPSLAERAHVLWRWVDGSATSWAASLGSDQAKVVPSFDAPLLRKLPEQVAFDTNQITTKTLGALDCSLDPSFEVLRITEPIHLEMRRSLRSWTTERSGEKVFVCLAWGEPSSSKVSAAALLPTSAADPVTVGVSDGGKFENGTSWVRLDVSGLVGSESRTLRIACMASSEPEDRGAEWDPLEPQGSGWVTGNIQTVQATQIATGQRAQASQAG